MIWALIEVVLPMLLTFLFGLLIGWLWWRRRTSRVESGGVGVSNSVVDHANANQSAQVDIANENGLLQGRHMQEQALAKELTAANASIRSLVAELDVTRTRLQSSESQLQASTVAVSPTAAMTADGSDTVPVDAENGSIAAFDQLRQLQQKYQELETSQSIDKAELAKKDHLESRLSNLTTELTENKSELADARKTASQLQSEVNALTQAKTDDARQSTQQISDRASRSDEYQSDTEIARLKAQLAEITPAAEQARDYQSQVAALQARLQQSESKVRQIEQSGERIDQLDSQLQSRLADELEKAQQQVQSLEQKVGSSAGKAAELVRIRSRVATLESELGEANSRAEDADKLQLRVTELETMLKGSEVKVTNERLVEAEAQLRIANNRVADQQLQINRLQIDSPDGKEESDAGTQPAPTSLRKQRGVASAATGAAQEKAGGENRRSGIAAYIDTNPSSDSRSLNDGSLNDKSVSDASVDHGSVNQGSVNQGPVNQGSASNSTATKKEDSIGDASSNKEPNTGSEKDSDPQSVHGSVTKDTASDGSDNKLGTSSQAVATSDASSVAAVSANNRQEPTAAKKTNANAPAWQAGVTRFGTPAARHKDDLKVIRGIGPVLERTLNEAEIQTWDQLAALQADEIDQIEQSMDFPGRMTRERWVEQATELVELYPDTDGRPSGKKLLPKKG